MQLDLRDWKEEAGCYWEPGCISLPSPLPSPAPHPHMVFGSASLFSLSSFSSSSFLQLLLLSPPPPFSSFSSPSSPPPPPPPLPPPPSLCLAEFLLPYCSTCDQFVCTAAPVCASAEIKDQSGRLTYLSHNSKFLERDSDRPHYGHGCASKAGSYSTNQKAKFLPGAGWATEAL